MKSSDSFYVVKEHRIIKYYDTLLLSELLLLNFEFSNYEYDNITGEDIYNFVVNNKKYSDSEKEEIIKNSLILLNIKYSYKIEKDYMRQFRNLDFKK